MNPIKNSAKHVFARSKKGLNNINKKVSIDNKNLNGSLNRFIKNSSIVNGSKIMSFVPPSFVNGSFAKNGSAMYEDVVNRHFNNNTPKAYVKKKFN